MHFIAFVIFMWLSWADKCLTAKQWPKYNNNNNNNQKKLLRDLLHYRDNIYIILLHFLLFGETKIHIISLKITTQMHWTVFAINNNHLIWLTNYVYVDLYIGRGTQFSLMFRRSKRNNKKKTKLKCKYSIWSMSALCVVLFYYTSLCSYLQMVNKYIYNINDYECRKKRKHFYDLTMIFIWRWKFLCIFHSHLTQKFAL